MTNLISMRGIVTDLNSGKRVTADFYQYQGKEVRVRMPHTMGIDHPVNILTGLATADHSSCRGAQICKVSDYTLKRLKETFNQVVHYSDWTSFSGVKLKCGKWTTTKPGPLKILPKDLYLTEDDELYSFVKEKANCIKCLSETVNNG